MRISIKAPLLLAAVLLLMARVAHAAPADGANPIIPLKLFPDTITVPVPPPPAGSTPAYLYGIRPNGVLEWHRHDGALNGANNAVSWQGALRVNEDFADFKQVFAGDNGSIYTISDDGILSLRKHSGFLTGLGQDEGGWLAPQALSQGWNNFKQAFSGGSGVLYAITNDGVLRWYKHGMAGGKATWEGPREIDTRWQNFKQVFPGGNGIIYALNNDGKLYWYNHTGYADGSKTLVGPKEVGSGWGNFKHLAGAGDGLFYAIRQSGEVMWFRQYGHDAGYKHWLPEKVAGNGWNGYQQVFALLSPRPVAVPPGLASTPDTGASDRIGPNAPVVAAGNRNNKVTEREKTGIPKSEIVESLETLKARIPFISNVNVVPDTHDVMISFQSGQDSKPLIEIGKVAPKPDRNGVLAFPFESGAFSRFVSGKNRWYSVNLGDLGEPLDVGVTYYYIINVFNDNKNDIKRPREQVTGKFTTLPQTVKVVWEKIRIVDDSDELSTGECYFWFWANHGQPSAKHSDYSNDDMDTGETYTLNRTLVLANAPDTLKISASGYDSDGGFVEDRESPGGVPTPLDGPSGKALDFGNDKNVGKGEFDLTAFPGTDVKVPFRLPSVPGGKFKFVVFGHLEITRPKLKPSSSGSQSIEGAAAEKKSR